MFGKLEDRIKRAGFSIFLIILVCCGSVQAATAEQGKPAETKIPEPRAPQYYPYEIMGTVFNDRNGNGAKDADEPGLPHIAVTDGIDIIFTGSDGRYEIKNSQHQAKLVYVLQPSEFRKTSHFYHFLVGKKAEEPFDFALQRSQKPETNGFRFVQTTDIHISGAGDVERFQRALREIAELLPAPDFIIATGDLVNNGNYTQQIEAYRKGVESSAVTHFNVFGNHDRCNGQDRMFNYNQQLGPDYYSFDHGRYHFLIINNIELSETEKRWIEKDVKLLGAGKEILAFAHYPHKPRELAWFNSLGVSALFAGHWHTSKINNFGSMRCYVIPTFVMGAIDNSPAGFLIVDVDARGLKTHYRFGGLKRELTIVYPSRDFVISTEGPHVVSANVYDSPSVVTRVGFKVLLANSPILEGDLMPEGEFTWSTPLPSRKWESGTYKIEITATNDRNTTWSAQQDFDIAGVSTKPVHTGKEWHMFAGTPTRGGLKTGRIAPPFALAWSTFTGGSIDFSSPILADKTIYIGVRDRNELEHNGISAIDARTGKPKWFFDSENAVNHSPAYHKGKVFAADVGGRLYALDSSRGKELWHYDLGSSTTRWIFSAPATEKGIVYAGSSAYFAALRCKTGSLIWKNEEGQDWITSYASPAVANDRILMGGMWISIKGKEGSLYAMDKANGTVLWQDDVIGLHGSPVIYKDAVFFNDANGKMWVVDLKSGKTLWSYQMEKLWSPVTPTISEPLVITGSGAGTVYALDINSHQPVWQFNVGKSNYLMSPYDKEYNSLLSSPTVADDIIYVAASNGRLYALDKATGKEIWSHSFGAPVVSTPLATGNTLFVATYDGHIYALTSVPTRSRESSN
jgi:outer membrane protein assembly factor BamB/predicted phosphodiesterase